MIFRNWGACALSVLVAFSLGGIAHNAEAARSAASSQQIKKKNVRVATKAISKKRVVAAVKPVRRQVASAAPIFRPPKAPAQRHYAVDGSTFYADGVRVRAAGLELLESSAVSSMGKQKLQQLLDSGRVSIEPLGAKDGDVTLARVRIDGQDVSELVSAR